MTKLTDLQQLIDDIASDAMSGALDMDVGVGELSDAASVELSEHLHEIIRDELKRVSALFSDKATATFMISGIETYVSIIVYPKGEYSGAIHNWASTLPAAIALVETRAAEYIVSNRDMCAADIGLDVGPSLEPKTSIRGDGWREDCPKCQASKFTCDDHHTDIVA
jgi:hypothetical protein